MDEREQLELLLRRLLTQTQSGRMRWDASDDGCYTLRLGAGTVRVSERDGLSVRNRCEHEVGRVPSGELVRQLLAEARLSVRHAPVVLKELIAEIDGTDTGAQPAGLGQAWLERARAGRFSPSR